MDTKATAASSQRRSNRSRLSAVSPLLVLTAVMFFLARSLGAGRAAAASAKVRVGSEVDFPPCALVDEGGQPAGFSVDLIKAVAGIMGLPIEFTTGSWDTVWNGLVDGRLDLPPIVAKSPERHRLADLSVPHTETFDAFSDGGTELAVTVVDPNK